MQVLSSDIGDKSSTFHTNWCLLSLFRVIPPEQQAEADELAAALSELQTATMHECQEVVGGDHTVKNNKNLLLWVLSSEITVRMSFQNAKSDTIAEWKTSIAEKTQKLVCDFSVNICSIFVNNIMCCFGLMWQTSSGRSEEITFLDMMCVLFGCVCQAQVKVDVSNLKEDIGKLKSQIVESPEELKSQMEKMRENVKNIKNSIVSRKADRGCLQKLLFWDEVRCWIRFCFHWFQEETDERVVELQNMVQSVTHTEAEIQQMYNLLQDLESSMNNTKQRQEEVWTEHKCSWSYVSYNKY